MAVAVVVLVSVIEYVRVSMRLREVKIVFIITHKEINVVLLFGTFKVQSFYSHRSK